MTNKFLYARPCVESHLDQLRHVCEDWKKKGITPHLHAILVGDNPASLRYIKNKQKLCTDVGAKFSLQQFPADCEESAFLQHIKHVNNDPTIHGALIQLPVGPKLQALNLSRLVDPQKDVDGFHPDNVYGLYSGKNLDHTIIPCTPKGIVELLHFYQIPIKGKKITIIGKSLIVGKPLSLYLSALGATVTLCHSQTLKLEEETKQADIIISAIGKPHFFDDQFFDQNKNQIVIDVGINITESKILVGDVNTNKVEPIVSKITPVPGGIGPMTVLSLVQNLFQCVSLQHKGR